MTLNLAFNPIIKEMIPRNVYQLGELEMLSPWFDSSVLASSEFDPARLILIVALPRSGSYLLCRQLWELGYGRPFEYCNPNNQIRAALSRFGKRPWQEIIRARSASPIFDTQSFFSCKIQPYQEHVSLKQHIKQLWEPLARKDWLEKQDGKLNYKLIFLRRLNIVRSAASWHFSLCTGAFDKGLTYTFQRWPMAALFDPKYLIHSTREYRRKLQWFKQSRADFPDAQILTHEKLVSDPISRLAALINYLSPSAGEPCIKDALNFRIEVDSSPFRNEREKIIQEIETIILKFDLIPDANEFA